MPEIFKQVAEKLNSSGSALIVLPPLPNPDAVASAVALYGFLKKLEKDAALVSSDGQLNPKVSFLPNYSQIQREINISKGFVIDISTKQTKISELTYKKEDSKLSVYLKPKSGQFSPEDISFRTSKYPYDVVITIGAAKLENLGQFYNQHAELFFETPIINIDYRGTNENFGQFNLVQLTAVSHSEIVFDLISEMDNEIIDKDVATSLLTGIIAETNSFQSSKTTPQAFIKASRLVSLGGDQQDIVNRLYKNKSMGFLKLWGRVLARIKHEPELFLVRSSVNRMDVEKAGAENEDVYAILKEMTMQLGFAKIHFFFREVDPQLTEVFGSAPASLELTSAFSEFEIKSSQPQSLRINVPLPLADAEQKILDIVRREAKKLS